MNTESDNKNKKRLFFLLLFLSGLLIVGNGYYFVLHTKKVKAESQQELEQAKKELSDTRKEMEVLNSAYDEFQQKYDALVLENDSMAMIIENQVQALSESKRKIDMLYARINQLKSDEIQNRVNEEALAEFSKERNKFLAQIDQLGKANQMLKMEIDKYKNSGETPIAPAGNINGFMARSITFQGLYDKKGELTESLKAKKVQKFKVGFYLTKNDDVKAGSKILYIRVLDPKGTIVSPTGSATINRLGGDIEYSIEREIEYPNEAALVYEVHVMDRLAKGVYSLEIYTDESLIGVKSVMLK